MDYYIEAIKNAGQALANESGGWAVVGIVVVVAIAAFVMFGKNVKWKR